MSARDPFSKRLHFIGFCGKFTGKIVNTQTSRTRITFVRYLGYSLLIKKLFVSLIDSSAEEVVKETEDIAASTSGAVHS